MENSFDHKNCPICHQPNGCQHKIGVGPQPDCWCNSVIVSKRALDMIPQHARGKVCICKACIERYC